MYFVSFGMQNDYEYEDDKTKDQKKQQQLITKRNVNVRAQEHID